jgi:hypothetical protein
MSVRSINFVRNVVLGKGIVPVLRPLARVTPGVQVKSIAKPFNTIQNRFYTSGNQQQASKISSMASSPEIIQAAKAEPKPSKLKELTRKYGAAGIVVYLAVSCVDLGVTFGVIQLVGLDKVKVLEKGVLDVVYNTGERFGIKRKETQVELVTMDGDETTANSEDDTPSFASVFILAYGIHKTLLLPVRLGITAAITPAIVRKLHQMGWARYFPRLLGAPKKP